MVARAVTSDDVDDLLAIHGGRPVIPEGPPSWPPHDEDVRAALEAAYADGSWGRYHSPHGERLAVQLAAMHGVEHVLLCSSGTLAVELALRGLNVGAGDEVILAGYDFGGNFRSIEAVGARPVLVDIHPQTWCLDESQIADAVSATTRAIIVSHLHGGIAAMQSICALAALHNLAVVEDACQSPGAIVGGRIAGAWGDVNVMSFGGSKLLTAGRGGAVLTRHADVHQRMKIFCERGNHAFPLSELQAVVLPPQIEKLAARNRKRRDNVELLQRACSDMPALAPVVLNAADDEPVYYKHAWLYDAAQCGGHSRDAFVAAVQAEGVAIDTGFRGFTRRPLRICRKVGTLPHSERAAEATVLLHHPVLLESAESMQRVATALRKVVRALATK
jgi:perosamine synthetase